MNNQYMCCYKSTFAAFRGVIVTITLKFVFLIFYSLGYRESNILTNAQLQSGYFNKIKHPQYYWNIVLKSPYLPKHRPVSKVQVTCI